MAGQPLLFKFDVYLYKNENISTEEFNEYMTNTYPRKAGPVAQKNGILQYAIVCCNYTVFPAHTSCYLAQISQAYLPLSPLDYD